MSQQAGRKELENRISDMQNEVHILREKNRILGASHAMLCTIYNAIPGMISVVDRDFNILDVSDRFSETIQRRKREEVIGLKCYKVNKGRDSVCPECLVIKAFESGEIQTGITVPEREATTGMRFKTVAAPIKDEQGEISGAIECIIDITDLKHIEEALKASEEKYRSFIDNASDMIFENDVMGNFTYINPGALKKWAMPRKRSSGRPICRSFAGTAGNMRRGIMRPNSLKGSPIPTTRSP